MRVQSPAITDSEVVIGASSAMSGPNAGYGAIARGMDACFNYLNAEQGGVKFGDGKTRKVKLEVLDDAMEPARALQNARRLVSQMQGLRGCRQCREPAPISASRHSTIPNRCRRCSSATGGPMFGAKAEVETYPWTMAAWLAYNTEAAIYAAFIKAEIPERQDSAAQR